MPEIFAGSAAYPCPSRHPVLTIGNFDGLHLGHRHLLAQLVDLAKERRAPVAVYTFDPPPRVVLDPQQHQPRIQPWPDKVRLLGELGVDEVIVERFTRAFAQHPPEWFAQEVLQNRIQPCALLLGYDFRFGRGRQGDVDRLQELLPNLLIRQAEALEVGSKVVSSSAIRQHVLSGNVGDAAALLGRAHSIRGTVVNGDQRGRTIGFPTANLETSAELLPSKGVYAVQTRVDGGSWMPAVANLGNRPTFDGQGFLIEVHILDFNSDIYGRELEVSFIQRLRAEIAFKDVSELVAQIKADVVVARDILNEDM